MNKSFTKKEMNLCLYRIASFRGLQLSCYHIAIMLVMSFTALLFTESKTVSPIYILLVLGLLPSLVESVAKSRQARREQQNNKRENSTVPFPLLIQKYHYSDNRQTALNFTYIIVLLLIAAWRFNYLLFPVSTQWICDLPVYCIAGSLVSRIVISIGYNMYFRFFPIQSMR